MENNERNKINKRNFFVRVTRKKAKQEIINKQRKLGRKLTWDEKVIIINEKAKKAKRQTVAWALAAAITIGGGAGYKMLNSGEEQTNNEETIVDTQNDIKMSPEETFREEMKVTEETSREEINIPQENITITPKTVSDIYNLNTKEEVLNWWKALYISEYGKITGVEDLTAEDIKIIGSSQSYVYILDNGQIVTHGSYIEGVENAIKSDGHEYTSERDVYTYSVRDSRTNEIIDCTTKDLKDLKDFKNVIHGDNYSKMKDGYNSVLTGMGDVTELTFELLEAISQDYKVSNAKSKLAQALRDYYSVQEIINDDAR